MTLLRRFLSKSTSGCVSYFARCCGTFSISHKETQKLSKPLISFAYSQENPWIWQQNDKVETPINPTNTNIDLPRGLKYLPWLDDPFQNQIIGEPPKEEITKHAVRMIVIRRKKMKKHKLKKLRKRMKFEWAKRRQKRELKKEKAFQAILIQQCKDVEAFSAEKYVEERIAKRNEIVVPRFYKGKRLPEFLIRQLMGLPPK